MSSPSLILHHYPMSPYAEKIRTMLGYANVPWQSVVCKEAPPRPHLEALAGGYRRIPVAQIGADVFCDSHAISDEIVRISQCESLTDEALSDADKALIASAEGQLFFAAIRSCTSLALALKMIYLFSFKGFLAFMKDRQSLTQGSSIRIPGVKESKQLIDAHLAELEKMVGDEFLTGTAPTQVDFAAYHSLWLMQSMGNKKAWKKAPKTLSWLKRMEQLSRPPSHELAPEEALAIAKAASPRAIDPSDTQHEAIGKAVSIVPSDYGRIASAGTLVASTAKTWVIAREHEDTGLVHVHFPKQGFELIPA
ncbi:glutathione S-transferase [Spongiibacter sp. KMU-158]|uniref:Glutathione S-transferase n=1 Tax=Spongiibacter pelagi TaxID=2760804 RepID=A0A927C101_9GAMM|nr:glutathione S-transferase family protein [Spongiibacter pelagi]MBD2857651.1 glutathione S-transferase [Spongiibacter pelagi]